MLLHGGRRSSCRGQKDISLFLEGGEIKADRVLWCHLLALSVRNCLKKYTGCPPTSSVPHNYHRHPSIADAGLQDPCSNMSSHQVYFSLSFCKVSFLG